MTRLLRYGTATLLLAGLAAAPALAHQHEAAGGAMGGPGTMMRPMTAPAGQVEGRGAMMPGPGMMGPSMMGPRMMGQGMTGQGMMGQGAMGPGMMGPGMMGPGMMGPGMMGQGMMGPGMMWRWHGNGPMMGGPMGPAMRGPGAAGGMARLFGVRVVPVLSLSVDDVRGYLALRLRRIGNDRLKLGAITAKDEDTIVADIVTVDDSLVQRLEVDRHTGAITYAQ